MSWLIGIDEAGYGPNLGPFVMTAVACQIHETHADANLWQVLRAATRQVQDTDRAGLTRLLVDDSKAVYSSSRGLQQLERSVLAILARDLSPSCLRDLLLHVCPADHAEVQAECWYHGTSPLPSLIAAEELAAQADCFAQACLTANIGAWRVQGVVLCPARFNALLDCGGGKGTILAYALGQLLRGWLDHDDGSERLRFFIDKHGGRNTYAAMIQDALPGGMVLARQESLTRSVYRVSGLGPDIHLTFQPRADADHFCVALASMTSKYLRELLMVEFNHFWREQVPGLKPTAGYPVDAARFLQAIRAAVERLGMSETTLWRRK